MKKSGFLIFLFCSLSVFAQVNVPYDSTYPNAPGMGITRYSDFPLDNIHILRLQEAASSLGGNVTLLKTDLAKYDAEHKSAQRSLDQKLSSLESNIDAFQRTVLAQLSSLQTAMDGKAIQAPPEVQSPVEITLPPYMLVLLGLNVFLLFLVIILIFWLREQYYVHKETHEEDHIHPAPPELVSYVQHQVEHKRSLHDVRLELAGKGWTTSIIEHAIHAAREK